MSVGNPPGGALLGCVNYRQRKNDKRSDKQEMPRDPARRPPSVVRFVCQGLSVLFIILVRDLDAMDALRCAFEVGGYGWILLIT